MLIDPTKIESTVNLFHKIEEITFNGNVGERFIDGFAYKLHKGEFPFSIAAEEVDLTFLPLCGGRTRTGTCSWRQWKD